MFNPIENGNRLRQLRGNRRLEDVASAVGVSASAMSMYESGERTPRDFVKLSLAKYFNTSVESIFFPDEYTRSEHSAP